MGSAIGAAVSVSQYRKQKKELKAMEESERAAEEEAKKLAPAEARNPDVGDDDKIVKRRGIQSTFTANRRGRGASTEA